MLTCFSTEFQSDNIRYCPKNCYCYHAPPTGIENDDDGESFICSSTDQFTVSSSNFRSKPINTIVLQNDKFCKPSYGLLKEPDRHSTLSLVLEKFNYEPAINEPYVFNLFNLNNIQYLTFLKSIFVKHVITNNGISETLLFNWRESLNFMASLKVIHIENGHLPLLDQTFKHVHLPLLHTLIIKSVQMNNIDPEALSGKESHLKKLIITGNKLRNWIWLTSIQIFPHLHHLDLTSNQLAYIPVDLRSHVPNLRRLYVAHNRFKYFSINMFRNWFAIDEFMLASVDVGKKYDYLVFPDKDMYALQLDIIKKAEDSSNQFPEFFLESLGNSIKYDCPLHQPTSVISWFDIRLCGSRLTYLPDNLYLNSDGRLMYGKDEQGHLDNKHEMIIQTITGTFEKRLVVSENTEDLNKYRLLRNKVLTSLNNQDIDSYRLELFDADTIFKRLTSPNSFKENPYLNYFLLDILEEAAAMGKFILLVLFQVNDVDDASDLITQLIATDFENVIIKPLMELVARHPALIGIEILGGFLDSIPSSTAIDDTARNCLPVNNGIEKNMKLLGFLATMIKSYSNDKLLGVSLKVDCPACLYYAIHPLCKKTMQFNDQYGLDFITFYSKTGMVQSQIYGYKRWNTEQPIWFKSLEGKPEPKNPSSPIQVSPPKVGIFYLLNRKEVDEFNGDLSIEVNKVATGYFVEKI